jgi:hypothetical protein
LTDEHDDAPTLPGVPGPSGGRHAAGPFDILAVALDAALGALGQAARVVEDLEGDGRDRALAVLELKAGELGDFAHDLRRTIAAVRREERQRR